MGLTDIHLPPPAEINGVLAATAAVYAALGLDDDLISADGDERRGGSGSGDDWARLVLLPRGRAVLYGMDQDEAEVVWSPAGGDTGSGRTTVDLTSGAPAWWGEAVALNAPLSFLYGYEDGGWRGVEHDLEDGFGNVIFPATPDDAARLIVEALDEGAFDPGHEAVRAVVAAGADVTAAQLTTLFEAGYAAFLEDDPDAERDEYFEDEPDADAGAERARSFELPAEHLAA